MIERGGRRDIFLGTRECQGYVKPCVFDEGEGFYDGKISELSFGTMYHGITYPDEAYSAETAGKMTIRLWNATMYDRGIIKFVPPWECIHRPVREMNMKVFGTEKQNFSVITEQEVMESCHG
jgi:CRISPR-associated protein Cas5d